MNHDDDDMMALGEEMDMIELVGDDGTSLRMEYLSTIEHEGRVFIVLAPEDAEETEEGIEVAILEMVTDGEGESFEPVEDEAMLQAVFETFVRLYGEEAEEEN